MSWRFSGVWLYLPRRLNELKSDIPRQNDQYVLKCLFIRKAILYNLTTKKQALYSLI